MLHLAVRHRLLKPYLNFSYVNLNLFSGIAETLAIFDVSGGNFGSHIRVTLLISTLYLNIYEVA